MRLDVEREQPVGQERLVRVDDLAAQELVADREHFRLHRANTASDAPAITSPAPRARDQIVEHHAAPAGEVALGPAHRPGLHDVERTEREEAERERQRRELRARARAARPATSAISWPATLVDHDPPVVAGARRSPPLRPPPTRRPPSRPARRARPRSAPSGAISANTPTPTREPNVPGATGAYPAPAAVATASAARRRRAACAGPAHETRQCTRSGIPRRRRSAATSNDAFSGGDRATESRYRRAWVAVNETGAKITAVGRRAFRSVVSAPPGASHGSWDENPMEGPVLGSTRRAPDRLSPISDPAGVIAFPIGALDRKSLATDIRGALRADPRARRGRPWWSGCRSIMDGRPGSGRGGGARRFAARLGEACSAASRAAWTSA